VDKHLVDMRDTGHETPRYLMLEPIREFGREALVQMGEDRAARRAHADWCLWFAETIVPRLRPVLRPELLDRIEAEHANLRTALMWFDDQHESGDLMKVVASLGWFWYLSGRWHEGLGWLRRAIDRHGNEATPDYVQALISAGPLRLVIRDSAAGPMLEQAQAFARASGNARQEFRAVVLLGIMANYQGDYLHAETRFSEAKGMLENLDDPWSPVVVDFQLGVTAYGQGRWDEAVKKLESTKSAAQEIGDVLIPAWCARFLTQIACEQHDIPRAVALLRQGQVPGLNMGPDQMYPQYLSTAAMLADALGEHSSTARLLGAAAVAMNDLPFPSPVQQAYGRAEATAQEYLGHDTYDELWQAGRRMRRTETESEIARILAIAEKRHGDREAALLTPREQDVLRLLIDGRSNPEIADALFISPHTAARHVTNILRKFNVESRAAAVAYAFQHDLA
jgi:DNA-binding CsgD family transcriptional regulator